MNLSKYYGKNIVPACRYCLYGKAAGENGEQITCEKGKNAAPNASCGAFRYEPTLRQPKEAPSLGQFKPEDFML